MPIGCSSSQGTMSCCAAGRVGWTWTWARCAGFSTRARTCLKSGISKRRFSRYGAMYVYCWIVWECVWVTGVEARCLQCVGLRTSSMHFGAVAKPPLHEPPLANASLRQFHTILFWRHPSDSETSQLAFLFPCAPFEKTWASYRCLWKRHSFCTGLCPTTQQRKLLSSLWFGVLQPYLPKGCLPRRSVFSQTAVEPRTWTSSKRGSGGQPSCTRSRALPPPWWGTRCTLLLLLLLVWLLLLLLLLVLHG